jgi:hypothetical protein
MHRDLSQVDIIPTVYDCFRVKVQRKDLRLGVAGMRRLIEIKDLFRNF